MQTTKAPKLKTKRSKISYAKWGYIFIAPFFLAYALFHFAPQLLTIYNSFFENYREGLTQVGPNFVGLKNYITLFTPDKNGTIDILKYAGNTIVLWVCGAIPQVVISLMLACFFTSYRLKIKGQQFFKTVIYMPNLIMASAFAMLFYMLFSNVGPINQILTQLGWIDAPIDFFNIRFTVRGLICLMNFLMWFGNTTILLMAGIMGIDQSLFEAANIDGASSLQVFFKVTLLQVVKRILAPMGNEVITLVKDTSLANTIANKEIIMMAKEYSAKGLIWPLFSTAIFFLVFVGALTLLFGWAEKKLDYFR